MDQILDQAKLDVTLYLRESVAGILKEWAQRAGERRALSLFLEFNFPFLNLHVQKILRERDPRSASASRWLKKNPCYPIDAYLHAERIAWLAFGDERMLASQFAQTALAEWFFLHDLKWFSRLLIAVAEAIEMQFKIDPNASMPKSLQTWCLKRGSLPTLPLRWLEGTVDGIAKLKEIEKINKNPATINKRKITIDAAKANAHRRKIFEAWASCWQAELHGLDIEIKLRSGGKLNRD